ncbi:hypothetical protein K437DRAFT_253599 [Tilletiaria anomala UBC 951]|uniref:INO80 complex subunit F domain-containing protein n=1 Tax=Tilletiaria anomala (strain ATCC 24038 / CBS 436.72 / UBC 951) TaxID=1037660 RepID=A0A066WQP3_TILAU|nr:uncharacterized protein K437DRAFT_253599 [Tilletiaria anomala UBC 951]KDN52955.1 hypothetical protein K437DRAFT_253599 [Tilletiaria anomala UBC 951]
MSASGPGKHKSKAYNSSVAIQSDAAKYRSKYKELKKKCKEIEVENDRMHAKTLRLKRNIQRMRLERALLYEKMEAEIAAIERLGVNPDQAREQGGSSWVLSQASLPPGRQRSDHLSPDEDALLDGPDTLNGRGH